MVSEDLGLKVRGVALWLKTLRGQSPFVVNEAFETLLLAADALHAKPEGVTATDVAEAHGQDEPTDRRVRASSAGGEEPCKGGLCDQLFIGEPACEPGECWAKEWAARSDQRVPDVPRILLEPKQNAD